MNVSGSKHQWFGDRTYAQSGEDLAVLNIFKQLRVERPTYLDIGAHHPFNLSNTALLYARGSRGINVDASAEAIALFNEHRSEDINVCVGVGPVAGEALFYEVRGDSGRNSFSVSEAVPHGIRRSLPCRVVTINEIVAKYADGVWPDFLSVDTEGLDLQILSSAEFGIGPRVVCVEAKPDIRDVLRSLMQGRSYFAHSWAGSNLIFVRDYRP